MAWNACVGKVNRVGPQIGGQTTWFSVVFSYGKIYI